MRHLSGGREAGGENETVDFLLRHGGEFGRGREAQSQSLFLDAFEVEPTSVVGDLDGDVARLVRCRNANAPPGGLARGLAVVCAFDAVIGAVADDMHQGDAQDLDQLTVEFRVRTFDDQIYFLAKLDREITDQPRQAGEQFFNRLHAHLHHAILQIGRDGRQSLQRDGQIFVVVASCDLDELVAGEHQFGNHPHDALDGVDRDTDGRRIAILDLRRGRRFVERRLGCDAGRWQWIARRPRFLRRGVLPCRHRQTLKRLDERRIVSIGLDSGFFQAVKDGLDAIDGR